MNQDVVVIGHEAVGQDGYMGGGEILPEAAKEEGPVVGEEEDWVAVYAAVVDMVVLVGEDGYGAHGWIGIGQF